MQMKSNNINKDLNLRIKSLNNKLDKKSNLLK